MLLDFEKPIAELEAKLVDMNQLASGSDKEVQAAVKALERKIHDLKRETFENLTGWQRVQLSRHPDRPYTLDYIYENAKPGALYTIMCDVVARALDKIKELKEREEKETTKSPSQPV